MTPPSLRTRILVGPALRAQPDRRLVALAREGHEPAVEEVVRRYRPALVRFAATIVPVDRADDVVQDSIARALPAIRGGDAELHLRPWLYTIVRNTAFNNIRDAGPSMDHLDESYDGVEQPPQALERRENLAAMVAGVRALPETQREALVKREMEGMSHSEIGAALGVSVAAARQLIHRGRITLREGLGALIPMPVMRQLLEGMSAPAAVGTGAGGALAAKTAVALLATGGALTAGVALDQHSHDPAKADPVVAERSAPDSGGSAASGTSGDGSEAGKQDSTAGADGRGAGSDQSSLTSLDSTGTVTDAAGGGRHDGAGPGDEGPRPGSGEGDESHFGNGSGEHHGGGVGGGDEHFGSGEGSGGHGSGGEGGSGEPSDDSGDGSGSGEGSNGSSGDGSPEGSGEGTSGDSGSSGSGSAEQTPAHPESD